MWLLGGGSSGSDKAADEEERQLLQAEAEELKLKLEALQAADYRAEQRASCVATARAAKGVSDFAEDGTVDSDQGLLPEIAAATRDLEEMHDSFGIFTPPNERSPFRSPTSHADRSPVPSDVKTASRMRKVEEKWKEREMTLQEQMEAQECKLASAAKALMRTRQQVQQLNAQLSLKDIEGSRMSCQVTQLRNLLVEKEKRLQDVMDERVEDLRLSGATAAVTSVSDTLEARGDDAQQPQEPPMVAGPEEEQLLLGMSRIAEELTEALEASRECEEETRLELEGTAAQLEAERAARRHREAEIASLQAMLASERARAKAMEERTKRVFIEDRMQRAFAEKKKDYHLHLEV